MDQLPIRPQDLRVNPALFCSYSNVCSYGSFHESLASDFVEFREARRRGVLLVRISVSSSLTFLLCFLSGRGHRYDHISCLAWFNSEFRFYWIIFLLPYSPFRPYTSSMMARRRRGCRSCISSLREHGALLTSALVSCITLVRLGLPGAVVGVSDFLACFWRPMGACRPHAVFLFWNNN